MRIRTLLTLFLFFLFSCPASAEFTINHTQIKSMGLEFVGTKPYALKLKTQWNFRDVSDLEIGFIQKAEFLDPHFEFGALTYGLSDSYLSAGMTANIKSKVWFKFQGFFKVEDIKENMKGVLAVYYTHFVRFNEAIGIAYLGLTSPEIEYDLAKLGKELANIKEYKDNIIIGINYFHKFYSNWSFNMEFGLKQYSFSVNYGI